MSSLHRRIASRLRFRDYIAQHRDRSQAGLDHTVRSAAPKHRSLTRLYRELYRLLIGYRLTIALALVGASMATLLKLIPPAATKAVIDYVILAHPLPAGVVAWSPVSLPDSPKARLVALVAWSWLSRCWASFSGYRAAGTPQGRPKEFRSRSAARFMNTRCDSPCTGSTSSSRAELQACCARMPAAWES